MKSNMKLWLTGFLLAAVAGSQAATITWTNTAGGSFQNANNWNPKTAAPGASDVAQFNTSAATPFTVTLDDNASVTNVTWPSGVYNMTLDLNGKTLTSAPGPFNTTVSKVLVGTSGTPGHAVDLTLTSSLPGGVFNLYRWDLFNGTWDSRGSVKITGPNIFVTVTNGSPDDSSMLRDASNTTFTVSAGAHLTIRGTPLIGVGGLAGSGNVRNPVVVRSPFATMLVTDPGTTYSNTLEKGFQIGKAGTNMPTVIVSNGAIFSVKSQVTTVGSGGDTWYSYSPKSNGKLIVTGTNTYFETSAFAMSTLAGEYGTPGSTAGGRVIVEKGGTLVVNPNSFSLSVGLSHYYPPTGVNAGSETNLNAYGEVILRDPGTVCYGKGGVQCTTVAKGAFYVLNGATFAGGNASTLYTTLGSVAQVATGTPAIVLAPAFTNDAAYGLFVVSNAGSVATFNGVQFANVAGRGDIVVTDNGRLSATNSAGGYIYLKSQGRLTVSDAFVETFNLDVRSNSTTRVNLGARNHASAYVKTTTLTLNAFSTLELGVLPNAALAAGETITLLQYTGNRTGTFMNRPEGSVVYADGGQRFRIYYGDGSNDAITLRYLPLGSLIIAL